MRSISKVEPMDRDRPCPHCGEAAVDGVDDQVALWGFGVHSAKSDTNTDFDLPQVQMRILHVKCLTPYVESAIRKLERQP